MIDLKDFEARRNLLETWYDRVLNAGELLQVDDRAIRDAKANLHAGRFVVAVCGQMNSGKSTLLNALLFSGEVLPSATTTTTAEALDEYLRRHADERRRDVLQAAAGLWADRRDLARLDDARASLDRDLSR